MDKTSALNFYSSLKRHKENKEIFKKIFGYEGLYKISNRGNVFSHNKDGIMKPLTKKGYLMIRLSKDGKERVFFVHRLVAQAFIPNPENLATVNHKDFNKTNNDVRNLEWMSAVDNVKHARENGRYGGWYKDLVKIKAQICHFCHIMKPIKEFRNGGCECFECEKARQTGYYLKRREKNLNENPEKRRYKSKFSQIGL